MAITAATKLSDFSGFLNRDQSAAIFEQAAKTSVVQQLVPRVQLGINGQSIPVVTGKIGAGWVAEGAQKPASKGTMALKTMDPKKIAAIAAPLAADHVALHIDEREEVDGLAFGSGRRSGCSDRIQLSSAADFAHG